MGRERILIIKHGAFGDMIHALGIFKAIRAHHADAHITLLTGGAYKGLALASGYVDDVRVDNRPKAYRLTDWAGLARWFRAQRFARVYDLQNSTRTKIYRKLFGGKAMWNRGAKDILRAALARGEVMHAFEALRAQVMQAGVANVTHDDLGWVAADMPALPRPYVLVVAGCSATRLEKRWPAERYIAVCHWLYQQGYTPVLIGTQDEADVTSRIVDAVPMAVNLTGQTSLMQIAVLARHAAGAVGNDTGPVQMIAPTGCRTLGLYLSRFNPARHGPLGDNVRTLTGDAIEDISVDDVCAALDDMLRAA